MQLTEAERTQLLEHAHQLGADIEARLEFHPDGAITVHARRGGDNPLQFGRIFTPLNLGHAKRAIESDLAEARKKFDSVR